MTGLRAALARRVHAFAPARQFRLDLARHTIEHFSDGQRLRVLDAGCEDGRLTALLARDHPAWTVVGADINEEALEKARADAAQSGVNNVEYACLDVTQPFADREYDVVAAVECLPQIPADHAAVHALAAALRPGGLLVVHVPEAGWRPVLRGSPESWKGETRHGYAADELRELLDDAGLEAIQIRPTTKAVLHAAEEIRARTKTSRLIVRAVAYPFLVAALRLEQLGITMGAARALFATARKPSISAGV